MMGRQSAPTKLFYDFDLENHVPDDHLLRQVDRFLDFGDIRHQLRPFYSHLGRPSIDPELIVRMLLIGYLTGIRSERRLCGEVHLNLAHRWFCRLGLDGRVPDHSTFSKYRHGKFRDSDLLRLLFEAVVARCIEEGLVGGTGFAVDASLITADVARMNSSPQREWDIDAIDPQEAPRAVREYLATLDDAAFGAATPVLPEFVTHADPASQWTAARKIPVEFTYSDNYLIDTDNAVILDGEPKGERDPLDPAGQGRRRPDHGGSRRGALRSETHMADSRHSLRLGRDPRLGRSKEEDRPLHPRLRQVHTHQRHLVAIGLYLGPRERPLPLSRGPRASPVPAQLLGPG